MPKIRNLISPSTSAERISVGIDIGSHTVKVIVAESENAEERARPRIIGVGYASMKALRRGYVTNIEEAAESIKEAVSNAEKSSGYRITKAYVGIGGIGIFCSAFAGSINLGDKDTEISNADVANLTEEIEKNLPDSFTLNRQIINAVPLGYKIDGKPLPVKPVGTIGKVLEAKVLFVSCLTQHVNDLTEAVQTAGIDIEDVVVSPFASSLVCLNKSQQIAGVVLINIGSDTTSIAVFEDNHPISLDVIPLGSSDITNDLALAFKVSLDEAERIKISRPESLPYPRKKIEEVVSARLSDIFDEVEAHLKKNGRSGLLPAGAIVTGVGALSPYVEVVAKHSLRLPVKKAGIKFEGQGSVVVKDGSWSTAYGLTILGMNNTLENSFVGHIFAGRFVKNAKSKFFSWIKNILP